MKNLLKYRESDFFNSHDIYVIYVNSLNKYFVTKCHWYNGSWFSDVSLHFKMTSILSFSARKIINKEISIINTELKGVVGKVLSPDSLGVVWNQGQGKEFKIHGFPNYWTNINNLIL